MTRATSTMAVHGSTQIMLCLVVQNSLVSMATGAMANSGAFFISGLKPLLPCAAMRQWALSRDPILQRFGAGGIARAAVGGVESLSAIVNAGGLQALVAGLTIDDPQANCYATGAIGELVKRCRGLPCSVPSVTVAVAMLQAS